MGELRYADGELDEVWAQGHIHIEMLDDQTCHILIKTAQGEAALRTRSTDGPLELSTEWSEGFKETATGCGRCDWCRAQRYLRWDSQIEHGDEGEELIVARMIQRELLRLPITSREAESLRDALNGIADAVNAADGEPTDGAAGHLTWRAGRMAHEASKQGKAWRCDEEKEAPDGR